MWRSVPIHMPRRCAVGGHSAEGSGPYYCTGKPYGELDSEGRPTGRTHELQISMMSIRSILGETGFVVVLKSEKEELEAEADTLRSERDDLASRLEEVEAELATEKERGGAAAIADLVAKQIGAMQPTRTKERARG